MPSSDAIATSGPSPGERRSRRLALLSLLLLLPATMAVAGWRDRAEVNRRLELDAIDVPAGEAVAYNGARVALAGLDAMPPMPGLPNDRTFVRARFEVVPMRPGGSHWLGCQQHVVDGGGRQWEAITPVPLPIEKGLRRPGELPMTGCNRLSIGAAANAKLMIASYHLVPRPALPTLRATISADGGRPVYLRFEGAAR